MSEVIESQGEIGRTFPRGTVKAAISAAFDDAESSTSGRALAEKVSNDIKNYVPDLPKHLVTLAWKLAILRDGMIRIDADHLEGVIGKLLEDSRLVDALNTPEMVSALDNHEGMWEFTNRMQANFLYR